MTKILYILQDSFFSNSRSIIGGKIAHIIGVTEEFKRLGYEVILYSFNPIPSLDEKNARYLWFKIRKLPIPIVGSLYRQWQIASQALSAIIRENPDLVYIRWTKNLFFHRIRKKITSVPIVMECNTPAEMSTYRNRSDILGRYLNHRIDASNVYCASLISAISSEVRDFLLHNHPSLEPARVIVNPNGVNTNRFCPSNSSIRSKYNIGSEAVVIGFAGNFRFWHRVDLLISAFQRLGLNNTHLLIMGSGPGELENNLRSQSLDCCSSQITFTGAVPFDKMPSHLCACDILVAPQGTTFGDKFHGSPIKLYEYMATQRAVIGSRTGQICEVIKEGKNGLLFQPNSKEDLERALRQLVENPSLRKKLGNQARSDVEKEYSWEANVNRIIKALTQLRNFNQTTPSNNISQ